MPLTRKQIVQGMAKRRGISVDAFKAYCHIPEKNLGMRFLFEWRLYELTSDEEGAIMEQLVARSWFPRYAA